MSACAAPAANPKPASHRPPGTNIVVANPAIKGRVNLTVFPFLLRAASRRQCGQYRPWGRLPIPTNVPGMVAGHVNRTNDLLHFRRVCLDCQPPPSDDSIEVISQIVIDDWVLNVTDGARDLA